MAADTPTLSRLRFCYRALHVFSAVFRVIIGKIWNDVWTISRARSRQSKLHLFLHSGNFSTSWYIENSIRNSPRNKKHPTFVMKKSRWKPNFDWKHLIRIQNLTLHQLGLKRFAHSSRFCFPASEMFSHHCLDPIFTNANRPTPKAALSTRIPIELFNGTT